MTARVDLVQLAGAPLDLELSARDVGRPLAQRALQVLDLDEGLDGLALPRLGKLPSEAQYLVAVGVLRLLPGRLPTGRFPRIPPRLHAKDNTARKLRFRAELGTPLRGERARAEPAHSCRVCGSRLLSTVWARALTRPRPHQCASG